jgi:hypothetical protein
MMLPDERLEPYQDEYGGVWPFYRDRIGDSQYSYTLQLPPEIHNYLIEHYVGTDEQGPLPADFRLTKSMIEEATRQWEAREGERPADMIAFRAAVEETVHHRYYREGRAEMTLDELAEQREQVVYDPLPEQAELDTVGDDFLLLSESSEIAHQPLDAGELEQVPQPPSEDFVAPALLEQAPLNFRDTADAQIHSFEEHMRAISEHSKTFLDFER